MKKMMIGLVGMAAVMLAVPETMAAPHGRKHDRGNDGLRLAAGIVHLVREVIAPTPVVVPQYQTVVTTPRPAVITPRPVVVRAPQRNHRYEPPRKPAPQRHVRQAQRNNHNNKRGNRR